MKELLRHEPDLLALAEVIAGLRPGGPESPWRRTRRLGASLRRAFATLARKLPLA